MFYYYGTKELKKELILEVYTREFSYSLMKNKKLRSSNSYTKAEKELLLGSYTGGKEQFYSPKFYSSLAVKRKTDKPVDL